MRLIGLDVGDRRIGVAKVDTKVKIAIPYGTVLVDGAELEEIAKIARTYDANLFVIGLPRNSAGVETAQSAKARAFGDRLQNHIRTARIHFQDESLTSIEAENRLKSRGRPYQKSDIDSEAATIILQDLIEEFTHRGGDAGLENFFNRTANSPQTISARPASKPLSSHPSNSNSSSSHDQLQALPRVTLPRPTSYRAQSSPDPGLKSPLRSKSNKSNPLPDYSNLDDAIFADLTPEPNDHQPTSLTSSAIAAKVANITSHIPSPHRLMVNISEFQIPQRLANSIRRLPQALSGRNLAARFHRASTSPSLNPIESSPDPEAGSSAPFSSNLVNDPTRPPRFKIFTRLKRSATPQATPSHHYSTHSEKSQDSSAKITQKSRFSGLSRLKIALIALVVLVISGAIGAYAWYQTSLGSVSGPNTCKNLQSVACNRVSFKIEPGAAASTVVNSLHQQKLIRSPLAFSLYLKFSGKSSALKAGSHNLNSAMTAREIVLALTTANNKDVFSFMIKPGETLSDIKKNLIAKGYGSLEVDAAFNKQYDHPILHTKPAGTSLEGYLYGETYEFFSDETVENIVIRALDQTAKVVREQRLEDGYRQRGLTLHQGLTLASIIQKETVRDHAIIAQIFEKRFRSGEMLGSDVTVSYAVNLVDPKRETYRTNADRLNIDSPYNTRKYPGLPPTPISAPGLESLRAVAAPADTDYLFFLTGDDQKMYYGKTSAEHEYNRTQFCRRLCAVSL